MATSSLKDLKLEDVIPSEIEKCKTDVIEIGDVYAQDELIVSPEERRGEMEWPVGQGYTPNVDAMARGLELLGVWF